MDLLNIDDTVIKQVSDELELYVYALVDPRSSTPFYVGKGRGMRHAAHGAEAVGGAFEDAESSEEVSRKIRMIREIRNTGGEPDVWILRYGMRSTAEYTAVEAACIDLLQTFPILPGNDGGVRPPNGFKSGLVNARTEASRGHGIIRLRDLIDEMAAPLLTTSRSLVLITLGKWVDTPEGEEMPGGLLRYGYGYKHEWLSSEERRAHEYEIGFSASGWWRINPSEQKKRELEYAVAAHRGVTRALMRIVPGSWEYKGDWKKSAFQFEIVNEGPVYDEIIGPHGHRVPPKGQNQFYWPWTNREQTQDM